LAQQEIFMKKWMMLFLALPLLGWAQSPFDGTWKADTNSAEFSKKPDIFAITKDGMYECKTCVPPIKVKADGQWHEVTGHPYADKLMVKAVDDKHVEQASQKGGKDMGSEKDTLSDDGKTMTVEWVDKSAPNGKEVSGKSVLTRVAAGPAGSHPFSGSWRAEKVSGINDEGLLFTYKTTADGVDWSAPTGQSYSAKFNGPDVPIQGDPGNTMVSIKKVGANGLEEIDKRNGKVVSVAKITVDGGKMSFVIDDKEHGRTMKFVAAKQ
jgi:hypothetical protein